MTIGTLLLIIYFFLWLYYNSKFRKKYGSPFEFSDSRTHMKNIMIYSNILRLLNIVTVGYIVLLIIKFIISIWNYKIF